IYSAERAKKSNNTNVLTMGARIIGPILAQKLVDMWLDSEYTGDRSAPKVKIIDEFEEKNFK
ncbi:MAG: RpiB/LacA/LacB family sugar-phosphate isomerase, partial [Atribacterota bacterium]